MPLLRDRLCQHQKTGAGWKGKGINLSSHQANSFQRLHLVDLDEITSLGSDAAVPVIYDHRSLSVECFPCTRSLSLICMQFILSSKWYLSPPSLQPEKACILLEKQHPPHPLQNCSVKAINLLTPEKGFFGYFTISGLTDDVTQLRTSLLWNVWSFGMLFPWTLCKRNVILLWQPPAVLCWITSCVFCVFSST